MKLKTILVLAMLNVFSLSAQADEHQLCTILDNIRFSHITVDDGLSHNTINAIYQDRLGYVWLGTRSGLCRYDGSTIKQYHASAGDIHTISHNFVTGICGDKNDNLWISTEGGICRYDLSLEHFYRYDLKTEGLTYNVLALADGNVYAFVSEMGFYRYDSDSDTFVYVEQQGVKRFSSYRIGNTMMQYGDCLLVGTSSGLLCYDYVKNKSSNLLDDLLIGGKHLTTMHVTSIATDQKGTLFFGTHNSGLLIFNTVDGTLQQIDNRKGMASNTIRSLMYDNGMLWIGSEMGIGILNVNDGHLRAMCHDQQDITGLNDNAVYSIYKDTDNNIWVGTYFGGVNLFAEQYSNFAYYPSGYSAKHLHGKAVRTIVGDDENTLWVSTDDGGIQSFDRRTRKFNDMPVSNRLSYHNIQSLLKDSRGNLWLGTFIGSLDRYNPHTGKLDYFKRTEGNGQLTIVTSLIESRSRDSILIGTATGLHIYSYKTGKLMRDSNPMLGMHIYCMRYDHNGTLWIGSRRNGIFLYEPDGNVSRLNLDKHFNSFITCLFEDSDNNMWVGSNDYGLLRFDVDDDTRRLYTKDNGLPSNSIMSINQDNDGNIWVSTVSGLCRIDKHGDPTVFDVNKGVPVEQFNYTSSYRCADGEMFFGSVNGLVSFYPERLHGAVRSHKIEITGLNIAGTEVEIGKKINRHVVLEKSIAETDRLVLTYAQSRFLTFNFAAFDFSGTEHSFEMRLDDSQWQTIGNQHSITFADLHHGEHTLMIRSVDSSGQPDESTICALNMKIKPPFWLTWYALCLLLILLAAIVYGAIRIARVKAEYKNQIMQERMRNEFEQQINRRKVEFFTNISHELKTPLTLITAPLKTLAGDRDMNERARYYIDVISRSAQRMLSMVDELMMFSKIEMGYENVALQRGAMMRFLKEMCRIFGIALVEKDIAFRFKIEDDDKLVWFSPKNLEKIVYNLVSNAYKFTPQGGEILVTASYVERNGYTYFHMEVSDNGIGIPAESIGKIFQNYYMVDPASQKGTGIGLALTSSLVKLHKGSIDVHSTLGKGSVFTVELNVSAEAYAAESLSKVDLDDKSLESYNYSLVNLENRYDSVDIARHGIDVKDDKPTILVVEDNKELNAFIVDIFRDKYKIYSVYDGRQAREMVDSILPDVVVSDIMMPEMDGLQLTKHIKSNLLTCHISVILLTAKTTTEDVQTGYMSGADAYVKKPFDARSLELQIDNIISTRRNNIRRFKGNVADSVEENDGMRAEIVTDNKYDREFMEKVLSYIKENIANESLSVSDITDHLCVSRSLLYMKLKKLTDTSAIDLIKSIRLDEAKKLLREGYNISETSYAVGIVDPNYFTKCFKKRFGITPSDFIRQSGK